MNGREEKLFEKYKGLIISIAKRFGGRGVSMEELFQIGCVGFLKAVNGFDKNFGTQFSTYAVPYITGEIKRFFRDNGQIKVSRAVKSLYIKICAVRDRYVKEFGDEPSVTKIAELLGEDRESVASAILAGASVSSIYGEDGKINEEILKIGSEEQSEICERITLNEAINSLSPKLKNIIEKRYFLQMTQAQIAEEMNTSQVQISRLEKKAIMMLRERIALN